MSLGSKKVTVHYGSGACTIADCEFSVISIIYTGAVIVTDKTPSGYILRANDKNITIRKVKAGLNKYAGDLFSYRGSLKINSVKVYGRGSIEIEIDEAIDHSDLITSNPEDLTVDSENLSATYKTDNSNVTKTSITVKTFPNQYTHGGMFFLKNGQRYVGDFHYHLDELRAMTGADHDENSKLLYYKTRKGLISSHSKDLYSSKPLAHDIQRTAAPPNIGFKTRSWTKRISNFFKPKRRRKG